MKGTALKKYCKKKDEEVKKDEEEERRKKRKKKKKPTQKKTQSKSSFHQQPNHNVHPFHVLYRVCSYLYFKFSIVIHGMISRLSIIIFFFLLLVRTCMYIISTVFKLYKNKLFFAFFSVRLLLLCNI